MRLTKEQAKQNRHLIVETASRMFRLHGMENVAVAGDWVGPEGMLADAAVSSALRAAAMVQRRKTKAAA